MGKKIPSEPEPKISSWQDEEYDGDDGLGDIEGASLAPGAGCAKTSRQRIEEYRERKRLAEALQEDVGDDILRR
ncbi:MAG TPA: hypothetical protein VMH34_01795 [Gammaproteobacteria bacterium]|nr:hypothetical protein [Gammaproteobacteria bacterium]